MTCRFAEIDSLAFLAWASKTWAALDEAERDFWRCQMKDNNKLVYLRSPEKGKAEMVITAGNHASMVHEVSRDQLAKLCLDATKLYVG